ncbi:MAG: B12-binding domain-containing radical SAM protein [Thermoplasmata archaeon]
MAKYVLVSDNTLMYGYRDFPLLDFLPCAPVHSIPSSIYNFLKGPPFPALPDGSPKYAPYSTRKLEASLLTRFPQKDIFVAHNDYLEKAIKDDTEVIGVSTMDPLGLGPTTMSYYVLFGGDLYAWVKKEWETLIARINSARKGKKAKLLIGGPGVFEFTQMREELDKEGIDYAFMGEADDIAPELFQQIAEGNIDSNLFYKGYTTYDEKFRRVYQKDEKIISRSLSGKLYPKLEEIPTIVNPAVKGMIEVMRGCGIGCDFCEVTLRPLRYYTDDMIKKEIDINLRLGGISHVWVHSDDIWGYKHDNFFRPNEDALEHLFKLIMETPGVTGTNPTHGRISIPSAYPELLSKLTKIMNAGPDNWIGIQTGLETGSERLAKKHMPNKTMPLKIGPDGTWEEIVWQGIYNETKYYWRSAFTLQVGQPEETDEDNWDTVAMINRLSYSKIDDGRDFEFTVTPLQNIPMGRITSKKFSLDLLTESQLAVYYASYRHLARMASRRGYDEGSGNFFVRAGTGSIISFGGMMMMKVVENIAKKKGVNISKVKNYGLENRKEFTSISSLARA